ncbi:hypothetical protein GVAV_003178 [Gurleya vavrai]
MLYKKYQNYDYITDTVLKTADLIFKLAQQNYYTECEDFFVILKYAFLTEDEFKSILFEKTKKIIYDIFEKENLTLYKIFGCKPDNKKSLKTRLLKNINSQKDDLLFCYKNDQIPNLVFSTDILCVFQNLCDFTFFENLNIVLEHNIKSNLITIVTLNLDFYGLIVVFIMQIYDNFPSYDLIRCRLLIKTYFSSFYTNLDKINEKKQKLAETLNRENEITSKNSKTNQHFAFQSNASFYKIIFRILYYPSQKIPKRIKNLTKVVFKGKENEWKKILKTADIIYEETVNQVIDMLKFEKVDSFMKTEVIYIDYNNECDDFSDEKFFECLSKNTYKEDKKYIKSINSKVLKSKKSALINLMNLNLSINNKNICKIDKKSENLKYNKNKDGNIGFKDSKKYSNVFEDNNKPSEHNLDDSFDKNRNNLVEFNNDEVSVKYAKCNSEKPLIDTCSNQVKEESINEDKINQEYILNTLKTCSNMEKNVSIKENYTEKNKKKKCTKVSRKKEKKLSFDEKKQELFLQKEKYNSLLEKEEDVLKKDETGLLIRKTDINELFIVENKKIDKIKHEKDEDCLVYNVDCSNAVISFSENKVNSTDNFLLLKKAQYDEIFIKPTEVDLKLKHEFSEDNEIINKENLLAIEQSLNNSKNNDQNSSNSSEMIEKTAKLKFFDDINDSKQILNRKKEKEKNLCNYNNYQESFPENKTSQVIATSNLNDQHANTKNKNGIFYNDHENSINDQQNFKYKDENKDLFDNLIDNTLENTSYQKLYTSPETENHFYSNNHFYYNNLNYIQCNDLTTNHQVYFPNDQFAIASQYFIEDYGINGRFIRVETPGIFVEYFYA